ncbi:hypothetical protein [Actinokineospora sp. HUAS TT18]|uniref:hypothetical protein n=1 Tax=Actinokineospora sp. HUAS TT18 TaxID=3447451 RepID=UPI003F51B646
MTTTDPAPVPAVAAVPEVPRLLREIIDTYTQALGEVDPCGPDTPELDPARVRSLLASMAAVADVLGEVCTDLLLVRHGQDSTDHEYLQDAQDAAENLAQQCRWAAAHVR